MISKRNFNFLLAFLAACGGNTPSPQAPARAQHIVATSELPNLQRCLGELSRALRAQPGLADVDLQCAAGIYQGQTSAGRSCSLQVDAQARLFRFRLEQESIALPVMTLAFGADGKAHHNIEDAGVPTQPGIQLTRFTGGAIPVTEAIALRSGAGKAGLPRMIYQRTQGSTTTTTQCVFGA